MLTFTFAPQFLKSKKQSTMKKFFAIAAIATVLVACGDSKTTTEEASKTTDSITAPATNAATEVAGAVDSAAKAVDSTGKAVVDSLNK
jgi:PBP1b-binding outer membrane lipoprotein LpoB